VAITTLSAVKLFLNKDDTEEDSLLQMLLDGVSRRMEDELRQPIEVTRHDNEPHIGAGFPQLVLLFWPVKEVNKVVQGDTVLASATSANPLESADWRVEMNRQIVRLSGGSPIGWPWGEQVLVTYKSGFETVPASLQGAAVAWTAFAYSQSKLGGDRLGLTSKGPVSGDQVSYTANQMPEYVKEALIPYQGLL
jgi:hypothetical protein